MSRPAGLGHNRGPQLSKAGQGWARHCWRKARADLLPKLPLEIVRIRVRRAEALGLDYKTYATVRATTGHDIVAFLFSTNALRVFQDKLSLDPERAAHLARISGAERALLANPPLQAAPTLAELAASGPVGLDYAAAAPVPFAPWPAQRAALDAARVAPADQTVLIGDAPFEPGWAAAGRLAAYLPADRIFAG